MINFGLIDPNAYAQGVKNSFEPVIQQNALIKAQQERKMNDIALQNAIRDQQNSLAAQEAVKSATDLNDLASKYRQAGLGKEALTLEDHLLKQKQSQLTSVKTQVDLMKNAATQVIANPTMAPDILKRFGEMTGYDITPDMQQLQSFNGDPEKIKQWAAGHALAADKLLPKFEKIDTGGNVQTGTVDWKGQFNPSQTINKTLTPYEQNSLALRRQEIANRPLSSVTGGIGGSKDDAATAIAKAIYEGRLDPYKVNSRNREMIAKTLLQNPDTNFNLIAGQAALTRNPAFQNKAMVAETIPAIVNSVKELGKKLNFSQIKTVGDMQAFIKRHTNDPDYVEYMSLRNDAIQAITSVMRGVGISDHSIKMEEEAAGKAMSPQAFEAWAKGQLHALEPRLKKYAPLSVTGGYAQEAPQGAYARQSKGSKPSGNVDTKNPLLQAP